MRMGMTTLSSQVSRWTAAALLATVLGLTASVSANHPVLVEGEKDFDGDGLIGAAENTDGDLVFGTITAALAAANGAAAQNGRVTIVTSGRFAETVNITGAGNVTVEAAPGVEANIDAVVTGSRATDFPGDNVSRQNAPGIVVNSPSFNRIIVLRNLVSRNWTVGVLVMGSSRVTIDNCRFENNVNYGIQVQGSGRVAVTNTHVNGTGYRIGAAGQSPVATPPAAQVTPNPGSGIEYETGTSGFIAFTTVTGSFGAGISNEAGQNSLQLLDVVAFDNNPDFEGVNPGSGAPPPGQQPSGPCPAGQPSSARPDPSWGPSQDCTGWVPPGHPSARR